MSTKTRPIFWLDLFILIVVMFLVIAQQWDYVLALLIALVVMNYFHRTINDRE